MKTSKFSVQLLILFLFSFLSSYATACTTAAWSGGVTGSPEAGSPSDNIPRISGLCAMQLTAAGSVKDTSPVAEPTIIARFYVKADLNSGTPVIFEAFSDDAATTSLISVTFDGTDFVFSAGDGASDPVPGETGWNLVELSWVGGTGMSFWVNADSSGPETGSISASAGTVESVVLGSPSVLDGKLVFDDYESHRTTGIGPSDVCNADAIGSVDLLDALEVIDEYFSTPQAPDLAVGSPDCDLSGAVDLLDALKIIDLYFGT